MDNKFKIIIAVVVVILLAVIGGIFVLGSAEQTLETPTSSITIPNDYTIDYERGTATKDDITITFISILGDPKDATELYKALSANGKGSGYENITNDTINGYKAYEYAAKTDNRTVVKYGSSTEWVEYSPLNLTDYTGQKIPSDHYRLIDYVSPNNSATEELVIFAKNPDTDLYTDEINEIINSITLLEK